MTVFRFDALSAEARYKLLCGAVTPRPVAWITTLSAAGQVNAAPFSFFNVFSEDPAIAVVGINHHVNGSRKDTVVNIEREGAFTINIASTALVDAMVATAAAFPEGVSEVEALGLATLPGTTHHIPRLADAPTSMECALMEVRRYGSDRFIVMGEIHALIARDGLFDEETLRIDFPAYDPVARLYGASYAKLSAPYDRPVPDWRTLAPDAAAAEDR